MLRTHLACLALLPAMALGYLACGGEVPADDPEPVATDDAAIVLPSAALIGTFRPVKREVGKLALLAFKSDGGYHRGMLAGCTARGCALVEDDGTYSLAYREGNPLLSLHSARDGAIDQYWYTLQRGQLGLNPIGRIGWTMLAKADGSAWCAVTHDCALQNLPVGPCSTDWYCRQSVCTYSCGPQEELE